MLKIQVIDTNHPQDCQSIQIDPKHMYNQECFIGRTSKCTITLPHIDVSRIHGTVFYQQGEYFYTDLASRNGSALNNKKLSINQKYLLKENDIIKIANFLITIQEITSSIQNLRGKKGQVNNISKTSNKIDLIRIDQQQLSEDKLTNPSPHQYMELALIPPEQLERWHKGNLIVRCAQIINETEDVKTFCFVATKPVLFTYQPGQFVTLKLDIDGKKIKRSYSISSTPSRPHSLEITVKRVPSPTAQPDAPPGLVSNWLHDNLEVGDEIEINGPLGKFTCFANPSPKLLFISAGSGITPMMSMSRWIFDTVSDLDVVFVHSAKTPKDIIYRDELEMMSARKADFRLAYNITRDQPGQGWSGYMGRLTIPMLASMAPDYQQRTVYVCGPNAFMAKVKELLEQDGFPMENYYEESFGDSKKSPKKTEKAEVKISQEIPPEPTIESNSEVIAPSIPSLEPSSAKKSVVLFQGAGKQVSSENGETILDLAENEAIEIDYSCRSGSCGTCKIKKLEGDIEYDGEPDALDEMEQEDGYILSCIAIPKGKVVVDETDN